MEKLTHRALVATARAEVKRLTKPAGMRSDVWHSVKELLATLAGYLPEVYPSQRTLATKLGCSQSSVHRRVSAAERTGLLTLSTRPNNGWMDNCEYHMVCLSEGLKAACSRSASRSGSDQKKGLLSTREDSSRTPSVFSHGSASGLADQARKEAEVARQEIDDEPTPIGADPDAPLPSHKVKPLDPAVQLALYFDQRWYRMSQRSKQWRGSRPSERGKAIGYLRGVMLTQVDEEMARAYMDAFISAVASGEVELKEGQLPFERFTGWWGREVVADPVETARYREIREQQMARIAARKAELDAES